MRLIEKVWFHRHIAKWLLIPLLIPLSLLFGLMTALRRLCFRLAILPSYQSPVPVLVVGNIGIGGNGKTPFTLYLINLCQQLNIKVGVLSRGYGGTAPHYPYLINPKTSVSESGDEPLMIFQRANSADFELAVVVSPDRLAGAKLLAEQGCQLILMDDGLQHYRLKRDAEVIVVDGKRQFGNGLLLPAGPLREGRWRLDTVDFVVVNGDSDPSISKRSDLVQMNLSAEAFVNLTTGEQLTIAQFIQQYPKVNALAGIGDPSRFFASLESYSIKCQSQVGFVDHHQFSEQDFHHFSQDIPLVMTEKDAVKCRDFSQQNWWYLPVSAKVDKTSEQHLIAKLNQLAKCENI